MLHDLFKVTFDSLDIFNIQCYSVANPGFKTRYPSLQTYESYFHYVADSSYLYFYKGCGYSKLLKIS